MGIVLDFGNIWGYDEFFQRNFWIFWGYVDYVWWIWQFWGYDELLRWFLRLCWLFSNCLSFCWWFLMNLSTLRLWWTIQRIFEVMMTNLANLRLCCLNYDSFGVFFDNFWWICFVGILYRGYVDTFYDVL